MFLVCELTSPLQSASAGVGPAVVGCKTRLQTGSTMSTDSSYAESPLSTGCPHPVSRECIPGDAIPLQSTPVVQVIMANYRHRGDRPESEQWRWFETRGRGDLPPEAHVWFLYVALINDDNFELQSQLLFAWPISCWINLYFLRMLWQAPDSLKVVHLFVIIFLHGESSLLQLYWSLI